LDICGSSFSSIDRLSFVDGRIESGERVDSDDDGSVVSFNIVVDS
jgi:hypothetical protein